MYMYLSCCLLSSSVGWWIKEWRGVWVWHHFSSVPWHLGLGDRNGIQLCPNFHTSRIGYVCCGRLLLAHSSNFIILTFCVIKYFWWGHFVPYCMLPGVSRQLPCPVHPPPLFTPLLSCFHRELKTTYAQLSTWSGVLLVVFSYKNTQISNYWTERNWTPEEDSWTKTESCSNSSNTSMLFCVVLKCSLWIYILQKIHWEGIVFWNRTFAREAWFVILSHYSRPTESYS